MVALMLLLLLLLPPLPLLQHARLMSANPSPCSKTRLPTTQCA